MSQLPALRALLADQRLDAVIISSRQNKFSHTGLLSSSGYVLVARHSQHIIVDFRYIEEVADKRGAYQVHLSEAGRGPLAIINEIISRESLARIGFEGRYLSFDDAGNLVKHLRAALVSVSLDELRQVKGAQEIALIRQACRIADDACAHIRRFIRPGMAERLVAAELEWFMKQAGAENPSFDTIVASGARGALPHAKASDHIIGAGELVTLDFGARYRGYCSDMTRTFLVPAADGAAPERHGLYDIYQTVLEAQLAAIAAVGPGVPCRQVDDAARRVIAARGYAEFFGHNTGHAVGIEVHETPFFSPTDNAVLQPGMLMTVEPGIYLPGRGGVRIEDMVLVTATGCDVLYRMPKTLLTTGEDD